jgi:putative membrane protein
MVATVSTGGGAAMMWGWGNGMGGWGLGLMAVGSLLVWALVVVGVIALLRHLNRDRSTEPRPTAEELLAERFARGDIAEQEYRERLDVLRRLRAGAGS